MSVPKAAGSRIPHVTEATFERDVLGSELPVLVDFTADWCEPCKQLAPLVEELAVELEGKLRVYQLDIDKNPRIARAFRVQSIPMLVVVNEGQVAGHHVGLLDRKKLRALVEPVLPREAAEVATNELAQLLQARRVVPVDVRDARTFGRYRIPGAVNVPAENVVARAMEMRPVDGRLRVLYGRTTDEARDLAGQLREKGVEVGFLAGGFLHWEADGLPVEKGAPPS